ncbi:MAG: hypothetical protein ABI668_04960 [Sphingorhabdus sp.]
MKRQCLLSALLLLASCNTPAPEEPKRDGDAAGAALDEQAIAAGIIPDPDKTVFAGRFETRSELGTDKFCAVSDGDRQFQIGVLAVFGSSSKCEARGTATVTGDKVHIVLDGRADCEFDARYDGIELRFPGSIESGCAAYCSERASLSGTHYFMVQPGDEQARKTLGRKIERLCD